MTSCPFNVRGILSNKSTPGLCFCLGEVIFVCLTVYHWLGLIICKVKF